MKPPKGYRPLPMLRSRESAPRKLDSINDLKKVDFGRSVPKHSLLLLYWFAKIIKIIDNGIRLAFDPTTDFGSHRYYNNEGLLDQIEEEFHYYTIGNLNEDFPEYILHPPDRQYEGGNLDRIVFRQASHDDSIDKVYLTQHTPFYTSAEYDPDHTYQISPTLLREIRRFSKGKLASLRQKFRCNINDHQLKTFEKTWGHGLGLFLFIVTEERTSSQDTTEVIDENRTDDHSIDENRTDDHSADWRTDNHRSQNSLNNRDLEKGFDNLSHKGIVDDNRSRYSHNGKDPERGYHQNHGSDNNCCIIL